MSDLMKAKKVLTGGEFTAVLCKSADIYTSVHRGVKPLVLWIEDGTDYTGFSAADKVVGKATAFLYLILGVHAVYAQIISKPALQLLQDHNIAVEYGELVENIINRLANGICPFEERVLTISDKEEAYIAIREKMHQMNISL